MQPQHWLVKQEPGDYPWATFAKDRRAAWTGVRNFQARNNLRTMRVGDAALYYHTGDEKQIVGIARVVRAAYPDPTAGDGDWSCVDLAPVRPLAHPVSLAAIKQTPALRGMALLKQTRLSVTPVSRQEFACVLELAGGQS